ncbi:MAG: hypothetical protein ACI9FN_001681 [Saprospiraceae bacterium]|jgi:hypothetical protein
MLDRILKSPNISLHVLLPVCCILIGAVILSTNNEDHSNVFELSAALFLLAIGAIYLGNHLINRMLNSLLNWKEVPLRRLLIQLILATSFSLIILNILYYFAKIEFTESPPDAPQYVLLNIIGIALIIPAISVFFGIRFLRALQQSEIEIQKIQKENTRSQMLSLRNHLDPHFLFNNLNILSSLIDHDIETSKVYLEKFAEVYRVILKSEMSDLTLISDELQMLSSYIYLLQIRFENNIIVSIDIEDQDFALPPLSLQMLIENAIKHNITSRDRPLNISLERKGDFLCICNNYQPKLYAPARKEGTGLENIKTRYAFFTDKHVEVIQTADHFCVNLPILIIEEEI